MKNNSLSDDACLFNYSPGPAALPPEVHQHIRDDLARDGGVPLLELGHRRPEFSAVAEHSEQLVRDLLNVGDDYAVLFLAGGATAQYAAIPLNLGNKHRRFDYLNTGHWSERAINEARRYGEVHTVAEYQQQNGLWSLSAPAQWQFSDNADYCHTVDNETLLGFELPADHIRTDAPLVSDMTSNFLTRRFDLERFGAVYAGAQKNAGIAGLAIVIVRRDLLGSANPVASSLQDYATQDRAKSMLNTPPIFAWYVSSLVLEWTKRQGGIEAMEKNSIQKSELVYRCIDRSDIYRNEIDPLYRSRLNVHFRINPQSLEQTFADAATREGLIGLRGHRAVGGIRASLYNAMPLAGAETLVDFMRNFEKTA